MANSDKEIRITLRLPSRLRDRLAEAASESTRSMNGEIVRRLELALEDDSLGKIVKLPEALERRVQRYATRHDRSLGEEVVRVLEREYPAPKTYGENIYEIKEILALIRKTPSVDLFNQLNSELLETVRNVSDGLLEDVNGDEHDELRSSLEDWLYEQAKDEEAQYDEEELWSLNIGRGTAKFPAYERHKQERLRNPIVPEMEEDDTDPFEQVQKKDD